MNKELKPSPKMKKGIKYIETALNVKFKGSTMKEASEFIGKYLEDAKKVDIRDKMKPSANMNKAIDMIEDVLGVTFEGSTMKEASEFIGKYLDQSREKISGHMKKDSNLRMYTQNRLNNGYRGRR